MTYAVSVVRDVKASPEDIWALVTDLSRMGEWSPESQGGEWVEGLQWAEFAPIGKNISGVDDRATHI